MVHKSHNTFEQDSGYTSTPTSTSPSKGQHFDGFHVIEINSVEKVRQPSMHTDLETLGLKRLQNIAIDSKHGICCKSVTTF
jgi:hypothetical protein